jgi:hypothetical protein
MITTLGLVLDWPKSECHDRSPRKRIRPIRRIGIELKRHQIEINGNLKGVASAN